MVDEVKNQQTAPTDLSHLSSIADIASKAKAQFTLGNLSNKKIEELNNRTLDNRLSVMRNSAARKNRSAIEHVQDAAVALGPKFAIATGQVAYGAADFISRLSPSRPLVAASNKFLGTDFVAPSLDEATGIINEKLTGNNATVAQGFGEARDIITKGLQTDKLNYALKNTAASSANRAKGKTDRVQELVDKGYSELRAEASDLGSDIVEGFSVLGENPAAISDAVFESLPQLFTGGALGNAAAKGILSVMTRKQADDFIATEAGKKALSRAATKANISYVAAQEGFSNAVDAQASVLKMSEADLIKSSERYRKLRTDMGHEEARRRIADDTSDMTLLLAGSLGAVTSKVTGAAKFNGELFLPTNAAAKNIINKATPKSVLSGASGFGREAVEEGIQSGGGTAAQNLAKKTNADDKQSLTEGVGQAVATGSLAGGITGGVAGSVRGTIDDVTKLTKAATKSLSESSAGQVLARQSRVDNAIKEEGGTAKLTDTESADYNPEDAIAALSDPRNLSEDPDKRKENIAQINKHIGKLFQEVSATLSNDKATEKEHKEAIAKSQNVKKYLKLVSGLNKLDSLTDEEITAKVTELNNIADPKEVNNEVDRVLGSAPTLEQAKKLLRVKKLDDSAKQKLTNYVTTQERIKAINTDEVHRAVLHGDETNFGLVDHLNAVSVAAFNGDQETAKAAAQRFSAFAKRHVAKYVAVSEAFAAYKADPNTELAAPLLDKYGVRLESGTGKIVSNLKLEAEALIAGYAEAVNLVNNPTVKTDPNADVLVTSDVSQTVSAEDKVAAKVIEQGDELPIATAPEKAPVEPETVIEPETNIRGSLATVINKDTLKTKLSNSLKQVSKSDGSSRANKVIDNAIAFINRVPSNRRQEATNSVRQGILAFQEGKEVGKSGFARYGYRLAKSFLKAPNYSLDLIVNRNSNIAKNFKTSNSKSVLSTQVDFFSNEEAISKALNGLDESALNKFADIKNYVEDFRTTFKDIFVTEDSRYLERKPVKELFQIPEGFNDDNNLVDTMGVVAYNWLSDKAHEGFLNDDEAITSMLPERTSDDDLTQSERELFGDVGSVMRRSMISLGAEYMRSIGMRPNKDTPAVLVSKMEISIGQQIIDVLQEQGLVQISTIDSRTFDFVVHGTPQQGKPVGSSVNYINVVESKTVPGEVSEILKGFTDNIASNRKVMDSLFNLESKATMPHFEIPKFTQKKIKGTDQDMPSALKRIVGKHSARENTFKKLMPTFMGLSKESQELISGVNTNLEALHALDRKTEEAKNEGYLRELQHLREFWDGTEDKNKPFYFLHEVYKNFRLGIKSNTINPQTSKIHRHALGLKSFTVELDINNKSLMDTFIIAVGEALGTSPDKESKENSVIAAKAKIADPEIKNAVKAFQRIRDGFGTLEDEASLVSGVLKGRNNVYSLDGIAALADFSDAVLDGKSKFTTDLGREVDGVTNGVAIGLTQFVAANDWENLEKMLERTGLFTDPNMSYAEWVNQPGNYDSYQDISLAWIDSLKAVHTAFVTGVKDSSTLTEQENQGLKELRKLEANKRQLNALRSLVGTFTEDSTDSLGNKIVSKIGRALAKNPVMITNYGAAMQKVIAEFANEILSKTHQQIAIAVNKGADGEQELRRINEALSLVVGRKIELNKERGLTRENDVEVFTKMISAYYGSALNSAMQERFGAFIESRKVMNTALNNTAEMYQKMYERRVQEAIETWKAENPDEKFIDLSRSTYLEIERGLIEVAPTLKHFFSTGINDSLIAIKTEEVAYENRLGAVEHKYKKPRSYRSKGHTGSNVIEGRTKAFKTLNTPAQKKIFTGPGVAGAILAIHGIDAATMYGLIDDYEGLNVHDAIMFNLLEIEQGTTRLNKSFAEKTLGGYSILGETQETYLRALAAYSEEFELEEDNPLVKFADTLRGEVSLNRAYRDRTRQRIQGVMQYNMGEGGSYVVESIDPNVPVGESTDAAVTEVKAKIAEAQVGPQREVLVPVDVQSILDDIRDANANGGLYGSDDSINPATFTATSTRNVDRTNSEHIFTALGRTGTKKDDAAHTAHLGSVLTGLVNKVLDPLKLGLSSSNNPTTGVNVGDKVLIDVGRGSLVNGAQLSAQEVYVHELLHYVTKAGVDGLSLASRELERLWEASREVITAEDFLRQDSAGNKLDKDGSIITTASVNYSYELQEAKKRYDYIYQNTSLDSVGRNNYLHEFLVFGVTNASFIKALSEKVDTGKIKRIRKTNRTIAEIFMDIVNSIMDAISERITNTRNIAGDVALMRLAESLANVEQRKKSTLFAAYDNYTNFMDNKIKALAAWTVKPLTLVLESRVVQKLPGASSVAVTARRAVNTNYESFAKAMKDTTKRLGLSEKSLLVSLGTEIAGSSKANVIWQRLNRIANKQVDQLRLSTSKNVESHLLAMFEEGVLTKENKIALNKVLLKADLSALLDDDAYTFSEIVGFIKDPKKLGKAIDAVHTKLDVFGDNKNYYMKMAKSLGHMMAKGRPNEYETKTNAYVIANMYETDTAVVGDVNTAYVLIDQLASLQALKYTEKRYKNKVADLAASEFARGTNENGITFAVMVHKDHKQKAFEQLFNNDPTMFVKGYTKEIYNPNTSFEFGSLRDVEAFAAHNYILASDKPLPKDPTNPNQEDVYMFVNPDGAVSTWQPGATSLTSKRAKGSSLVSNRIMQSNSIEEGLLLGEQDLQTYYASKSSRVSALMSDQNSEIAVGGNSLVPVINNNGDTTNYRYLMTEAMKDTLLEKNNDFAQVLGAMEASIGDKVNSETINKEVVNTAFTQYKSEFGKNPQNFVLVGMASEDKDYREIYHMLPTSMRREIYSTWGMNGMYVPDTMVPLIFGQRKWSITDFGKDGSLNDIQNKVLRESLLGLAKALNKPWIKKSENIWQEVVKLVKDIIVIRSGVVLVGNIVSNMLLLIAKGVNPINLVKNHTIAINQATKYQRDAKELDRLEREVKTGNVKSDSLVRIARLKNSLATNKVKDLIEEGIYQSIVEDISTVDDQYTYKNALEEWASPFTDKIPNSLKTSTKYLTVSQDTAIYKFLRDATQMSDFVARYTLHEANLKAGISKEASLDDIVNTFIDYDVPTHKGLQYANDMGMVMFTKFFLRIQRVIADLIVNHPSKTLSIFLLQNSLGNVSDILDSFALTSDIGSKLNTDPVDVLDGVLALPVIELVSN